MKVCSKCGIHKPESEFSPNIRCSDGVRSACKSCCALFARNAYKSDPDKYKERRRTRYWSSPEVRESINARSKQYRIDHQEEIRIKKLQCRVEHRDAENTRSKQYRIDHQEEISEERRKHRAEHPEMAVRWAHNRRARKTGALSDNSSLQDLLVLYGPRCLACGTTSNLTIDHIVPLVKGGSNTIDNKQVLCKRCNDSKGTKTIDYRRKA